MKNFSRASSTICGGCAGRYRSRFCERISFSTKFRSLNRPPPAATELIRLRQAAAAYHLDVLMEVHTLAELERARQAGAEMIGINNRDLGTFTVDLSVTEKLSEEVPDEIVLVSESGIKSADDVARMEDLGVDAILVGEALMRGELSIENLRD